MGRVTGGRAAVDALLAAGVSHAFCVPGESFLGLLDAMAREPRMRVISTRHEEGAAFMAVAHARITGRPAACMGTRMVGAANLAIGIHTARQDSVPLIALLGQTRTDRRHREAFQEVELAAVFAPLVKWAVEVPSAERIAEIVLRAGRVSISGRPGPVAVILREDLSTAEVPAPERVSTLRAPRPAPDPGTVAATMRILRTARRPVMVSARASSAPVPRRPASDSPTPRGCLS